VRYRPFGPSASIVSAVSVMLSDGSGRTRPADWTALIYAALESGINCFEVAGLEPAIMDGLAQALQAVERRLLFVSWRVGEIVTSEGPTRDFSPEGLTRQVCAILARTGVEYLDAINLDDPESDELRPEALGALADLKASGAIRMSGVAGDGEAIDAYVASGAFDVLCTPFNLTSGWKERHRLRLAVESDMAVMGYRAYPADFHQRVAAAAKSRPKSKSGPLAGMGSYGFLDRTHGWDAEEICIAHALTEPALATVQIAPTDLARLEQLAGVADREMPPGLAAQIEMARFAPETAAALKSA
jgi:aryl-alcohol dehydrogenase-like predicted oxidoreductase